MDISDLFLSAITSIATSSMEMATGLTLYSTGR
jgi:hypothetical protein